MSLAAAPAPASGRTVADKNAEVLELRRQITQLTLASAVLTERLNDIGDGSGTRDNVVRFPSS
ncbi:hypothetical protein ACIBJD_33715 [Kitasatospora sp. NPDC050467]|uniref:hypothetical protein n=1 Tax=Kitasatospora sp. NPDC050467 TaxID=3364053 RepID=UPI0037AA5BB0